MNENEIQEKLKDHEHRLDGHDVDINKLKVDSEVNGVKMESLQKSIDKLCCAMEKMADKFDEFKDKNNNRSIETWKIVLISVAIPTIFFLLQYIAK